MKSKIELKKDSPLKTLDYLQQLFEEKNDAENANLMLVIKGNLSALEKGHISGLSTEDDYQTSLNKISLNILKIIDTLPDNYFSIPEKAHTTSELSKYETEILSLLRELADIEIKEVETSNPSVGAYLNAKRHLLAIQALRMIDQTNISISSLEYSMIAYSFFRNVDIIKAEAIYKKAIENTDEYSERIRAIRGYANFLYNVNRSMDGAKQYESAILEGNSEADNIENGYTFQMKFFNECDIPDYENAIKTYKRAKDYYLKIGNSQVKSYNLSLLETGWNNKKVPSNYSRP